MQGFSQTEEICVFHFDRHTKRESGFWPESEEEELIGLYKIHRISYIGLKQVSAEIIILT